MQSNLLLWGADISVTSIQGAEVISLTEFVTFRWLQSDEMNSISGDQLWCEHLFLLWACERFKSWWTESFLQICWSPAALRTCLKLKRCELAQVYSLEDGDCSWQISHQWYCSAEMKYEVIVAKEATEAACTVLWLEKFTSTYTSFPSLIVLTL